MEEMWLARDKNGKLFLFMDSVVPKKNKTIWVGKIFSEIIQIPSHHFPEVKWSDKEPTKVKLIIEK